MRRLIIAAGIALSLSVAATAADESNTRPAIKKDNRYQLIRLMNAEFAWVKLSLPHSQEGIKIHPDGKIDPHGRDFQMDLARYGPIARPGERVQITNVEIRDKSIYLELNGGAVKKSKWYQRLTVGGMGGEAPVAAAPDNSRAMGTSITVEFKRHVPEMTAAELKQILSPLLDFSVKSAAQAYAESLPKNVQDAIKEHRVLVGMNKEMVTYSVGRPPQRIREKDQEGKEYEEWIYGQSPADVQFVRFEGDVVSQLKIMKVGGDKIVKTTPEVKIEEPKLAQVEEEKPLPRPANAPTLRRPGEKPPAGQDGTDTIDRSISIPTHGPPTAPPSQKPAPPSPDGTPQI